ncbi:hypothetical protein MMC28_000516 [Mycoblastus sanguinarius]|nr:hypothetical protein [Mycoblastus sanguinarius]
MAGQELFKKRHQLRAFNVPSDEQNFPRYKPSDIHVTTDFAAVPMGKVDGASTPTNGKADTRSSSTSKSYDRYTVNISSVPFKSRPSIFHNSSTMSTQQRRHKAAMEANRAAFGYTKVALLFFVSLLVTWVPSSINRVYALAHPDKTSVPLAYAAGIVLSLMGFWNAVIYISTSRAACRLLILSIFSPDSLESHRTSKDVCELGHRKPRPRSSSWSDSIERLAGEGEAT